MAITTIQLLKSLQGNSLDLSYKKLTEKDVPAICEFLENNPYISTLNLYENNIGRVGAELLAKNKTLESLDIGENSIEDEGAQAFEHNKTLKSLKLNGNLLRKATAAALARNKYLLALDIGFNHINDEGAKALANNKVLQVLDVNFNNLSDDGVNALVKSTSLRALNIQNNNHRSRSTRAFRDNPNIKLYDGKESNMPLNWGTADSSSEDESSDSAVQYIEHALQNDRNFFKLFDGLITLKYVINEHPEYEVQISEALIRYSKVNAASEAPQSINNLMKSSDAFAQLVNIFPEQNQRLFKLAIKKLPSLVSRTWDLIQLGKLSEDAEMDGVLLEKAGLYSKDFYKKYISSSTSLVDLAEEFPFHKSALIRPLMKDKSERLRLVHHGRDVVALAAAFPKYRDRLIEPILTDPVERARFMYSGWYPPQACNNLCELANFYPEHQADLITPMLSDPKEQLVVFQCVWDLEHLTKAFPEHSNALIELAYTNPAVRNKLLRHNDNFLILSEKFPVYNSLLFEETLKDPEGFSQFVYSTGSLRGFSGLFPAHKDQLIRSVLKDANDRTKLIRTTGDLCELAEAFPEQRDFLLQPFLDNPSECIRILNTTHQLKALIKAFPEHEKVLIGNVLKHQAIFTEVIGRIEDLEWLMQQSPRHLQRINRLVLEDEDSFVRLIGNNPYRIRDLINLFPQSEELIYSKVILYFSKLIKESYDLSVVADLFPAHRYELSNHLFSTTDLLQKLISGDLNSLLTTFPKERKRLMSTAAQCAPNQVLDTLAKELGEDNEQRIMACINEFERSEPNKNKAVAQIKGLQKAFEESNKMLTPFQRRHYAEIRDTYIERILNLLVAMGPSRALLFMTTVVSKSAMRFEQFLKAYELINRTKLLHFLNRLMQKFAASLMDKKSTSLWQQILITLSVLSSKEINELSVKRISGLEARLDTVSLEDVIKELSDILKYLCLDHLHLEVDSKDINQSKFDKLMGSRFANLLLVKNAAQANNSDSDDQYDYWYKAMLACDITNRSLDNLLHSHDQKDSQLRLIAQHNSAVRKQLAALGLNTEKVVYYNRTHSFTYTVNKQTNWTKLGTELLTCLKGLTTYGVKELVMAAKIVQELTKGKNAGAQIATRIQSSTIELMLGKFDSHLQKLKSSSFRAGGEVKGLFTTLEALLAQYFAAKERLVKHCVVQQWDKSRPDTFFLGNYLNCCLQVSGASFKSIIERRLDDAIPIHVVIDQETNEPICGAWLFWAQDEHGAVKLVANFIEIAQAYASNDNMKNIVVANLLYFIAELYAKDVALKDTPIPPLVIRHLTYGDIKDLTKLDPVTCKLSGKIGGFCKTSDGSQPAYYLDALKTSNFYQYTPGGLKKQFPDVNIARNVSVSATQATFFDANAKPKQVHPALQIKPGN